MQPFLVAAVIAAAPAASPTLAVGPEQFMVELTLKGQRVEGTPLAWSERKVHLLGRDGRLWEFAPAEAARFRQTSGRFQAYSPSQLRAELLRELGQGFEVTGTSHYLVAHPRDQRDKWAERFEDLYRSFVHYFGVREAKLQPPPFPLIGIVLKDRGDFDRYVARQGVGASPGLQGWYAIDSNRIVLYDTGGKEQSRRWQETAAVVIHEATHQTAFNTGIHSRCTPPPLWVAEGLATLFEAPGVYDSRNFTRPSDRVNRGRLADFQRLVQPRHKPELLSALVASDQLFRSNPPVAYAEAWALTFYLVETDPRKYAQYLARTGQRPPFTEYTPQQRTADFTAVFGSDWRMLEAGLLRLLGEAR